MLSTQNTYCIQHFLLDVGAGTGILSLFCMKAGAKRVYAVEASNMAITLKKVVSMNDKDNIIQVLPILNHSVSKSIGKEK